MRAFVACLFWLIACGPADAQEAVQEHGLGPYRFGMTVEEVRATAPRAQWVSERQDDEDVLSGGPRIVVGGSMDAALVFADGGLRGIVLVGLFAEPCESVVPIVVESLEPLYGPFRVLAPHALEPGRVDAVSRTQIGSEIRMRRIEADEEEGGDQAVVTSARYGAMTVVVQGREGRSEEAGQCRLRASFGPQSSWYRSDEGHGPTLAELDAAQTLAEPDWRVRPTANTFERYFPSEALQRRVDGLAVLDCLVIDRGTLNCRVMEVSPGGMGFGGAALGIAEDFRLRGGAGAYPVGHRIRVPIRFNVR